MPRVYVSIGSNSNREQNIALALGRLKMQFGTLQLSSIYESPATDGRGELYYNLVAGFDADMAPSDLREFLRGIEDELGRQRDGSARVSIDLDLLLHGSSRIDAGSWHLPHPDLNRYRHVLQPLAELAPDLILPGRGQTVAQRLAELNPPGELVKLWSAGYRD